MVHVGLRHRVLLGPGLSGWIEHVDDAHWLEAALGEPLDDGELAGDNGTNRLNFREDRSDDDRRQGGERGQLHRELAARTPF